MGSTPSQIENENIYEDHPHIHGEHAMARRKANVGLGSPPYTWGALEHAMQRKLIIGITPIYMGSTKSPEYQSLLKEDHPHIHGEHIKRSL